MKSMAVKLVAAIKSDLEFIKDVYNHYIQHSTATFHTEIVEAIDMVDFIPFNHSVYNTYLIKQDNVPCGYCYFGAFKPRQAYNRTAEITLYLLPEFSGKGLGSLAVKELESVIKKSTNIKTLLAVITGSNLNSIKLFEQCGYVKCAHYKEVGEKFGELLDVVSYQKFIS